MKFKGVKNTDVTVAIAVKLTDKAILPFASEEIKFDTFPPGQAATSIMPNATAKRNQ